jgi:hypothetical protein
MTAIAVVFYIGRFIYVLIFQEGAAKEFLVVLLFGFTLIIIVEIIGKIAQYITDRRKNG